MKTILFLIFATLANAQSTPLNSFTFSGGYARDIHAYCCETDTAVSLGVTYSRRMLHYLDAEIGLSTALNPIPEIRGASYDIKPDTRFIWLPFGARGVLPLHGGRLELSAGGGGLYEKFSVSNPSLSVGLASRDGFGGYFVTGAAVALDHNRHFWLGASPRWYLVNTGPGSHDRWFTITGDVSFRF